MPLSNLLGGIAKDLEGPSFWYLLGLFVATCWFLGIFITQLVLHLNLHGTCVADENTGKTEYKKHPGKEAAFAVAITGTSVAFVACAVPLGYYCAKKYGKKAASGGVL